MKASLQQKLTTLVHRHEELSQLLSNAEVVQNQNLFRDYSKEYAALSPVVDCFNQYQETDEGINQALQLQEGDDKEMAELADEELKTLKPELEALKEKLTLLLLPKDPNDDKNIFLEIRAGTGGDEAAIFVGDLFRMYSRYAERQGWQLSVVSANEGEHGGYKEVISRISGNQVYSQLKFESGVHRVQRVPLTESQGRVHTSACTVAVIAEADEIVEIDINPADLRVDTYRASGAGGQHVNKTDSAVRLTHIPTGTVVECQDERSQHKNRARAMSLLKARILAAEEAAQQKEQAETRRSLVGSGDRSERIRTYNYPQGRVTDHRINLTLYKLDEVVEGDLAVIIEPLTREFQADQLAAMGDDG